MSTVITEWPAVWGVPQAALQDLIARLTVADYATAEAGRSEAAVQNEIRLAAARLAQVVPRCSECEDTGVGVIHGYDCTSCYGELPAAPQPPAAQKGE